jgi:enterochelin esterase-like enzyme
MTAGRTIRIVPDVQRDNVRRVPLERYRHASRILAGNPLGDPCDRELLVYLPPSYFQQLSRRYPVIFVLAGYTGVGLTHFTRMGWLVPMDERMDRLIAQRIAEEAILVFPDCFTRYGGSQYIDSPAVGRYESYLTEELVPFIDAKYRTIADRSGRAVLGKSSGGYGAMILAIHRPDLFGALASHAGDCAFDICYGPEWPTTLLWIERHGGLRGFLEWFDRLAAKPDDAIEVMSNILAAACWSPAHEGPYGYGVGFEFPFDLRTCARIEAVWRRWLEWDPVQLLDRPEVLEHMRSMRAIYLDGGLSDEYNLQLGTRQVAAKLAAAGIAHVHEEFEGGHFNVHFRFDRSLEVITRALAQAA